MVIVLVKQALKITRTLLSVSCGYMDRKVTVTFFGGKTAFFDHKKDLETTFSTKSKSHWSALAKAPISASAHAKDASDFIQFCSFVFQTMNILPTGNLLNIPPFPPKNCIVSRVGGSLNFLLIGIIIVVLLKI
jgi:hypothetical protein